MDCKLQKTIISLSGEIRSCTRSEDVNKYGISKKQYCCVCFDDLPDKADIACVRSGKAMHLSLIHI